MKNLSTMMLAGLLLASSCEYQEAEKPNIFPDESQAESPSAPVAQGDDAAAAAEPEQSNESEGNTPAPNNASHDANVILPPERPENKTCLAFTRPVDSSGIKLQRSFSSVSLPQIVGLYQKPGAKRWYAIQRTGQITTFEKDDGSDKKMFVDISKEINSEPGEAGLLGMAWHPSKTDTFFLSYTLRSAQSPANLRSTLARFTTKDPLTAEFKPENLLSLEQPYNNHNGGHIAFGRDNYLYMAFGDGGSGGDPQNRAQNLGVLFGKILRLDIDGAKPYAIPKDNPFVNQDGKKGEIYAYGLRNPWRFSFDSGTGEIWAGDVGQGAFEEIDLIKKGGNYGWKIKEGFNCYNASSCNSNNLIDPVVHYGRGDGASVTGGFVYRGKSIPSLRGIYLYADFISGNIFGLIPDQNGKAQHKKLMNAGFNISSFAQDSEGELYVLEFNKGNIHRIVPNNTNADAPKAPAKLSETGCFEKEDPTKAVKGLIPYELNSPLWSDAAAKRRWMALPDGQKMTFSDSGRFEFPRGTVLVKEFAFDDKPIETRLFILHEDGVWAGYTYEWKGKDADLLLDGAQKKIGEHDWTFPSQGQCLQCHNQAAGNSLGLAVAQLDRTVKVGEKDVNQMKQLEAMGFFSEKIPEGIKALPVPGAGDDHEGSARSYLHANCSFCHRTGGTGGGNLDMRFTTALADTGLCKAPGQGDLGISEAEIVSAGKPDKSVLLARISRRGNQQMPPLASTVVDKDAVAFVTSWITNLKDCP